MSKALNTCAYSFSSGRTLHLQLDLEPAAQSWQQQSATSFTDDSGAYLLNWVEEAQPEGGVVAKVHLRRADGGEFKIVCAKYKMHFDACGIQKIWPTSRLCFLHGNPDWDFDHWGGDAISHASSHDPFVMALTASGIIAVITFGICCAGLLIGKKAGTHLAGKAGLLGGIILILIGLEIFITNWL